MGTKIKLFIVFGIILVSGFGWAAQASDADQPPLHGTMGDFTPLHPPIPAPPVHFSDPGKGELDLTAFKGRFILLNLWATWCGPCLEEMPSLMKLKQAREGTDLRVVNIAEDRSGPEAVKAFLSKHGFDTLDHYVDPDLAVGTALGLNGMPTTYLIDPRGRIVGRLEGKADWNSAGARALIEWYLSRPQKLNESTSEKISVP